MAFLAFLTLLVLTLVSLAWLHAAVLAIKAERRKALNGNILAEGSAS